MTKLIIVSLFASISFINSAFSCDISAPVSINMQVDLETQSRYFYSSRDILKIAPTMTMQNCTSIARSKKFVMIGLGLESLTLTNQVKGYSFIPRKENLDCRLENTPFSNLENRDERFERLTRKREFLNRCVKMQVTELNERVPLRYPKDQPGCSITSISRNSADFSGPFCFFQPYTISNYSVQLELDSRCTSKEYLQQFDSVLTDYNIILNTYIAGDASGVSQELTAKTTTPVRLSYNADKNILKDVSDNYGQQRPQWPAIWTGADLILGEVTITPEGRDNLNITTPFIVNNKCERSCVDNLCSSPCDYSQPIVGEFSLYEVMNSHGDREFIKLWYDGAPAPAQYQGFLYGIGGSIPYGSLEDGRVYEIEAIVREPDLDFQYLSGQIDSSLRLSSNTIGDFGHSGTVAEIPTLSSIPVMSDIDDIPAISGLVFDQSGLKGFERVLATWQAKLKNDFWPPNFSKVCKGNEKCVENGSANITMTSRFSIETSEYGQISVNQMGGGRKSNLVSPYSWTGENLAKINCDFDDNLSFEYIEAELNN